MAYVVSDECILCGACVTGCPVGAVEEGETQAYIDPEVCIECGTCEQNCPTFAIFYDEMKQMKEEQGKSVPV